MELSNIIGVVLFTAVLVADILIDYKKWKNNYASAHHNDKLWKRAIALFLPVYLIGWQFLPALVPLYWFLFNGGYNVVRDFDWWFTGSDDKDDAKTDDFLQSLTLLQQKLVYFGSIATGIVVSILINNAIG